MQTALAAMLMALDLHAGNEGAMRISVLRPDGSPYAGVRVQARVAVASPTQINSVIVTHTDFLGTAYLPKLTPGIFTIQVEAEGFSSSAIRTDVKTDQVSHLTVILRPQAAVEVAVEEALDTIDVTSVTTTTNLSRDAVNTAPIAKKFSSILAQVPGLIQFDASNNRDEPNLLTASAFSPTNVNGRMGNNTYMLDGIDVTQPFYGNSRVDISPELIADIDVKTGGITAEYVARSGAFFNATTISGGNDFHGGVNFTFSSPTFQSSAHPGRSTVRQDSYYTYQAFVSGGMIPSRIWYVGSFEKRIDKQKVTLGSGISHTPGESRVGVFNDEKNVFGKLTWQVAPSHRLVAEYHSNNNTYDEASLPTITNNRVGLWERGGDRYLLWYSWQTPNFIAELRYASDKQKNSRGGIGNQTSIDVLDFTVLDPVDSQFGTDYALNRVLLKMSQFRLDINVPFRFLSSIHLLKFGGLVQNNELNTQTYLPGEGYFQNIKNDHSVNEILGVFLLPGQYYFAMDAINRLSQYGQVRTALDTNGDGLVDDSEMRTARFDSRYDSDSRHGNKFIMYKQGDLKWSRAQTYLRGFYVQDAITLGRLSINSGFRVDEYRIFNDLNMEIYKSNKNVAPRLGFSVDLNGDARSKVYAFFGRYFDAPRLDTLVSVGQGNMTAAIPSLYLAGQWIELPPIAGNGWVPTVVADGFRIPHTDELKLGYETLFRVLDNRYVFTVVGTLRQDRDIAEDFDPWLYTSPDNLEWEARAKFKLGETPYSELSPTGRHVIERFRALAIDPREFASRGRSATDLSNNYQYVMLNAPGGKRDFRTLEVTLRRDFQGKWGWLASYTWVDAQGNMLSQNDAASVGNSFNGADDPRLAYNNGRLAGTVTWAAKAALTYGTDWGLKATLIGNFNSGFSYHLLEQAGFYARTQTPAAEGLDLEGILNRNNPMQKSLDLHVEWGFRSGRAHFDVFLDINNLLNRQAAIALAEGDNLQLRGVPQGEPYIFQPARRVSAGVRYRF